MNKKWPANEIIVKKTEELIPYARNSRTHSPEQIKQLQASIREWGWTMPVLIDPKNNIICGHGRIMAADAEGIKEVPCIIAKGWSEAKKKAYIIADNKLALNAEWDEEILSIELLELKGMDFDLSLTGFDDMELESLFDEEMEGLTDEDAVPDVPEEPVSKLGDIFILGNHRLMCGDSTDKETVEKLMDGNKADQMVTDHPYNVDYEGRTKDTLKIKNDKKDDKSFREFLVSAFQCAFDVMKPGAVFYIWHADLESYNFRGAIADCGQIVRSCLVWNKQSMVLGRSDYHWKHEPCLYGWKEGAAHLWASDRTQTTILDFNRPSRSDVHPTMKPVDLMEYQIKNNTKGDAIVLDLFGGSGSTLIACEKTGRSCYMMELDPHYVDVIIQRYFDFVGDKSKIFLSTNDGKDLIPYEEVLKMRKK